MINNNNTVSVCEKFLYNC